MQCRVPISHKLLCRWASEESITRFSVLSPTMQTTLAIRCLHFKIRLEEANQQKAKLRFMGGVHTAYCTGRKCAGNRQIFDGGNGEEDMREAERRSLACRGAHGVSSVKANNRSETSAGNTVADNALRTSAFWARHHTVVPS